MTENEILIAQVEETEKKLAVLKETIKNNNDKTWIDAVMETEDAYWEKMNGGIIYIFNTINIDNNIDVMRVVLGFKHVGLFGTIDGRIGLKFRRNEPTYRSMQQALLNV